MTDEEIEREMYLLAGPGPYGPKQAEEIRQWAIRRLEEKEKEKEKS